ncbi:MAG: FAD-dependent oxidoreductase [Candidatus Omnitrophica bacterium]|nr:FAD-dependent oxidoreductase [Candidatus Omnitrophota bacterium]
MKHYDSIVVGSGISGLTIARLLAMNGQKVLIIEKGGNIGGSMARFYKNGVPFDTGFHFTGAFLKNGILNDMLIVLGIQDTIKPIVLPDENGQIYVFENDNKKYFLPNGVANFVKELKKYFPEETRGIDDFFSLAKKIYNETSSLDLSRITEAPRVLDEDDISLQEILDKTMKDGHLKGILSTFSMCYGVKPSEVSVANHFRVAYGMYDSVVRIKNGGKAFIDAFNEDFIKLGIEVKTNCTIDKFLDIEKNIIKKFILSDGETLSCDQCIFTIHPKAVVESLPEGHLSKAFLSRINDFEPAAGFFTVYGTIESDDPDFVPSIVSILPSQDINVLLEPTNNGCSALVLMTSYEKVQGKIVKVLTAMEPSFTEQVAEWIDSKVGRRPGSYYAYKENKIEQIKQRIYRYNPAYKDSYKIMGAASILTYRDYLNSFECTAYGIKQKMGQFNLFGKLPLKNIYACGQSSVLPGVVGAMMSSFIIARSIVGRDEYDAFIKTRLNK